MVKDYHLLQIKNINIENELVQMIGENIMYDVEKNLDICGYSHIRFYKYYFLLV